MARERWLFLAASLALLGKLPACSNTCLNPQPEPPGNGCSESHSSRPTAGQDAGRPDGGAAADARSDLATDARADDGPSFHDAGDQRDAPSDAGTDGAHDDAAPEASSDSDAAVSSDAPGDRAADAPDGSLEDGADALDDGTNDALEVPADDGP